MILPDANLLIYAYNSESKFHNAARSWLGKMFNGDMPLYLCWQNINAFIRITTNPKLIEKPILTESAFKVVEEWLSLPNVSILNPGREHLKIFRKLAVAINAAGPIISDVHLASLAIEHGATLATTDRDFRLFDGLKTINPLTS